MCSENPQKRISCSRCQSRKIRCNRVDPQCDKCEAAGQECVYLPRKHRARNRRRATDGDYLSDVLRRLQRLEDHCGLSPIAESHRNVYRPMSISTVDSDTPRLVSGSMAPQSGTKTHPPADPPVEKRTLSQSQTQRSTPLPFSSIFCHLRNVESRLFGNENCVTVINAAMAEIARLEETQEFEVAAPPPVIPKEMARQWIETFCDFYHFEGYRLSFDKSFLMSIPDLLEIPHVQLDHTSQLIYYSTLRHGVFLDSDDYPEKGRIRQYLYDKCRSLTESWLRQITNTPGDFSAAMLLLPLTLESCNIELSWKLLGHACTIAKALGYFRIDADPGESSPQEELPANKAETEVDRNRRRFEFWHLLRGDCLFRLSFGKPALIPEGSWAVNFPDLTINGVEDASTCFIQIHFLASMRLTLVMLKYLNLVEIELDLDAPAFDISVDSLISEVQSIMSDWDAEELLSTTKNSLDTWLCMDLLFNSYKMLIVLYQAKKCSQGSSSLPYQSVDMARNSLRTFESLVGSTAPVRWGINVVGILLHQFIPLLIVCLDAVAPSRHHAQAETDLALVARVMDFVEKAAEERTELKAVKITITAIILACQHVKLSGNQSIY